MSTKLISALILLSWCFYTIFGYSDCGSEVGSVISVTISDCNNSEKRCILKRNTNASITINFTTNEDAESISAVVHGVILGVPVPFTLPNSDACKDSGLTCPISSGQTLEYKNSLPVLAEYPRELKVDVKWELKDKDGKDLVCILIPSQLK